MKEGAEEGDETEGMKEGAEEGDETEGMKEGAEEGDETEGKKKEGTETKTEGFWSRGSGSVFGGGARGADSAFGGGARGADSAFGGGARGADSAFGGGAEIVSGGGWRGLGGGSWRGGSGGSGIPVAVKDMRTSGQPTQLSIHQQLRGIRRPMQFETMTNNTEPSPMSALTQSVFGSSVAWSK
jgi:hypothetical protein